MASSCAPISRDDVEFVEAPDVRKGNVILLKNQPAKVKDIHWSAPGKHGAAKYRIVAVGLFSEKRIEETFLGHARITAPRVERYEADVLGVDAEDHHISLFDVERRVQHDRLRLDGSPLHGEIRERQAAGEELVVDVLCSYGQEQIVAVRSRKESE